MKGYLDVCWPDWFLVKTVKLLRKLGGMGENEHAHPHFYQSHCQSFSTLIICDCYVERCSLPQV